MDNTDILARFAIWAAAECSLWVDAKYADSNEVEFFVDAVIATPTKLACDTSNLSDEDFAAALFANSREDLIDAVISEIDACKESDARAEYETEKGWSRLNSLR